MMHRAALVFTLALSLFATRPATATELVMVEEQGCYYCIIWKNEIGPIYPKSAEGSFAPLRMIDLSSPKPSSTTAQWYPADLAASTSR